MSTHDVTDGTFDAEVLGSDTPVLVDFWGEWCGPCEQLGLSLKEIASEMSDKVKVVKLNVGENPDQAAKFGVRSLPTMMLFKGGELIDRRDRAMPKAKITQWLAESI